MDAIEKLKAKHKHKPGKSDLSKATIIDLAPPVPPKTSGSKRSTGGVLNEKEEQMLHYLQINGASHIKQIGRALWANTGIYHYAPGIENTDPGKKGYRWAANSKRKLLSLRLIVEVGKGTYQATSKGMQYEITSETPEEETPPTPAEWESFCILAGAESKSEVARMVGIERRRWARIVGGAEMTDDERKKFEKALTA